MTEGYIKRNKGEQQSSTSICAHLSITQYCRNLFQRNKVAFSKQKVRFVCKIFKFTKSNIRPANFNLFHHVFKFIYYSNNTEFLEDQKSNLIIHLIFLLLEVFYKLLQQTTSLVDMGSFYPVPK